MPQLVLIAHNLRSTHNVGSLLRTCDGLGVDQLYLTGYTPYPLAAHDERLPHQAQKIDTQIHKTALGAETTVAWEFQPELETLLQELRKADYGIVALEQAPGAIQLVDFRPSRNCALLVGREVEGIEPEVLGLVDQVVEIPMRGHKESFNVAIAAAIALYHCTYLPA